MTNQQKTYLTGAIGILIVIGLVWWGQANRQNLVNEQAQEINVGAILPLSGPATYFAEQARKGLELAVQDLAQQYPHLQIKLLYDDSMYTPKGGVTAYQNLKNNQQLDTVITLSSQVSVAVQPLANQDDILQMAIASSADNYSTPNDLSVRVSTLAEADMARLATFIKDQNYQRLAILYLNNDFGISFAKALKTELQVQGATVQIPIEESFVLETKDYRASLTKIKQVNPNAIFVVSASTHTADIIKQAKEINLEGQFLAARSLEDPVLIRNAGRLAEGIIYTYAFDPERDTPEVKNFVQGFREKYSEIPDGYSAEAYEGLRLIAQAFNQCGKNSDCLKKYIHSLRGYSSIFGPLDFDSDGDVRYEYFLKTVRNGQFVKYE